ncbi:helix-turn-helix transcriptional regulator [Aequorivita flava]|uniref:Helix-turn-helix transcriptional regulator n=1 Tax=Aequorivita flava TaxID=3114371 RepID=A0AB35YVQ4_9FLAO
MREDRRMSQEAMGALLGISQPQYQRKETGFAPFTEAECEIIAAHFNVPIEEILETSSTTKHNHHLQDDMAQVIYFISDRLIEEIKEMNGFLKKELLEKKEENLKLKEQVEVLQRKLKSKNDK